MLTAASPAAVSKPGEAIRATAKATFATGDFAEGLHATTLNVFLLFYLTAACGLHGWLTGLAIFASLSVDAVADPIIGFLTDSAHSSLGRRHPFMFASIVPWFLSMGLLFSVPTAASQAGMFVYVLGTLIVVRISNSLFMLPFSALGAEIVRDYHDRSLLGSFRAFFNSCGSLTCILLGFDLFMRGEGGLLRRQSYVPFGWALASLIVCVTTIATVGTLRMRYRMHTIEHRPRTDLRRFWCEIREVIQNRSFRILFMTVLIFWSAQGTAAALTLHVNLYFWRVPASVVALVPVMATIGLVSGVVVAPIFLRRFAKHQVCIGGIVVFCVVQFFPVGLRLLGMLNIDGMPLYVLLYGNGLIAGCAVNCAIITFGAMMADSADEHEMLYGSRREGLYFAGLVFSAKAAFGIGALVSGVVLDVFRFPHDIASMGPHPNIAFATVRNLALVAGPGAAAVAMASAFILTGYQLDARKVRDIQSALGRRHAR